MHVRGRERGRELERERERERLRLRERLRAIQRERKKRPCSTCKQKSISIELVNSQSNQVIAQLHNSW